MCQVWEKRVKCTGFWWESLKEGDQGTDGIRLDLGEIGCVCVCVGGGWIHLAQDRDWWQDPSLLQLTNALFI
jgi:hypothetical protein